MDYNVIQYVIQYVGYVVGIISSGYAIYVRKKLFHLQSKTEKAREKTEKAKAKSYQAKAEAEKARKAEHATGAFKNFVDLFRGSKKDPTGNVGEVS